ncbi:glutathione S-transferase, alpha tandem duplicate 1 [Hemiscyllium ocellatum]|uniref:glutathione S-transferase, alpha tandem duplicate 1 n=1 Tax=Hemiscyllium ocellatum TaxID=170820 RepID=UPI002966072B|nr:glutathione S-transferase, alpha tandem duplicate 1 [Hemiscyllium ocellatum]XP_060677586.1 glutathione S-transferase, alpha tandem duplicate 1 [Hemiscyllium ocellatum]
MSKPKLHYFNGRGKMESIRWLLAVAGVEFEEEFLETRDQYEKLLKDGALLFEQVPMVEIDGMKLVQTNAILNYIAAKYNLYGKDIKERALIDMYAEGARDLMTLVMRLPFAPSEQKQSELIQINNKAKNRYFPAFEKVLKSSQTGYLVGNQLSVADLHLLEAILMIEDNTPHVLKHFPCLEQFKLKLENIQRIQKFLQPGSPRKSPPDDHYIKVVKEVLRF